MSTMKLFDKLDYGFAKFLFNFFLKKRTEIQFRQKKNGNTTIDIRMFGWLVGTTEVQK